MENRKHRSELRGNKHFRFFKCMTYGLFLAMNLVLPAQAETHALLPNQQQTNQQINQQINHQINQQINQQTNQQTNQELTTRIAKDVSFGRLFTTPEQRTAMDEARRRGGLTRAPQITGVNEIATGEPVQAKQQIAQPFKLSGVLLRADGQHQVWVSGESGKQENPDFSRKILGSTLHSANVKVPLQGNNRAAILKPGQVWLPDSDRAEESYRLAVPKPAVVPEPVKKVVIPPAASSSASAQTSASVSEVSSSVQSSAK